MDLEPKKHRNFTSEIGLNLNGFLALSQSKFIWFQKFWHFFHITFNAQPFLFNKNSKKLKIFTKFFENL